MDSYPMYERCVQHQQNDPVALSLADEGLLAPPEEYSGPVAEFMCPSDHGIRNHGTFELPTLVVEA
jgi:hypothetical protein